MKISKASNGKTILSISEKEWINMGENAKWLKTATHDNLLKLRALSNEDLIRFRLGEYGETEINWGEWQQDSFYIQKHNGEVIIFTPNNVTSAEFRERDYHPQFDYFDCEEYCIQIDWDSI